MAYIYSHFNLLWLSVRRKDGVEVLSLYLSLLPVFMLVFGASWLLNIFKDFFNMINDHTNEIQHVEVMNIHDLNHRK